MGSEVNILVTTNGGGPVGQDGEPRGSTAAASTK